jgi:hypothetical protein
MCLIMRLKVIYSLAISYTNAASAIYKKMLPCYQITNDYILLLTITQNETD